MRRRILCLQFGGHRFANGVVDNEPFAAFPDEGQGLQLLVKRRDGASLD
jgi:hypothetical protein